MPDFQQLTKDPDFLAMSPKARRLFAREYLQKDPDFQGMSQQGQSKFLNEVYARHPDISAPKLPRAVGPAARADRAGDDIVPAPFNIQTQFNGRVASTPQPMFIPTNPFKGTAIERTAETGKGLPGLGAGLLYGAGEPLNMAAGGVGMLPKALLGAGTAALGALGVKSGVERATSGDPVRGIGEAVLSALGIAGGGAMVRSGMRPKGLDPLAMAEAKATSSSRGYASDRIWDRLESAGRGEHAPQSRGLPKGKPPGPAPATPNPPLLRPQGPRVDIRPPQSSPLPTVEKAVRGRLGKKYAEQEVPADIKERFGNLDIEKPKPDAGDVAVGKIGKSGLTKAEQAKLTAAQKKLAKGKLGAGPDLVEFGVGAAEVIRLKSKGNARLARQAADELIANHPQMKAAVEVAYNSVAGAGKVAGKVAAVASVQQPQDPTVAKVGALLKQAKPSRKKTEDLYSEERRKRSTAYGEKLKQGSGEAAFRAADPELKGELPYADFAPIRQNLTKPETDKLFDMIRTHEPWQHYNLSKRPTEEALTRLLDPTHPKAPAKHEIEYLEEVFGPEFVSGFKRPSLGKEIVGAVNLPKALMASLDRSAVLRQSLFYTVNRPVKAAKNFITAEKAAWGKPAKTLKGYKEGLKPGALEDEAFQQSLRDLRSRPNAALYTDSKLDIIGLTSKRLKLADHEEAYMSGMAEKIPWIRNSERAYTGYLNQARADYFDLLAAEARKSGDVSPEQFKSIAEFVNIMTGRGSLGKTVNQATPLLNNFMFSPRFVASRLRFFDPTIYAKLPPGARKAAAKDLARFVAGMGTAIYLAKTGLEARKAGTVETDARSSDFWKIKVGKTRMDVLGGYTQYIRAAWQVLTGEKKVTETGQLIKKNRAENVIDFARSKGSPVAGYVYDQLKGRKPSGEKADAKEDALDMTWPLILQDLRDAMKENGPEGIGYGIPAMFGVSVTTHLPKAKK